jgi:two-component system LytT family response regulator
MKIVLADDEPLARALLRALLDELPGLEVVAEAADGVAAIEAVAQHRPDLVFLDIDMPGRNGIHAALEIQRDGTEVIFVTAHEEHAVDAFDVGAIDYLLKPVRRPRLIKAMERARLRHDARQAPAAADPPTSRTGDMVTEENIFWIPVRSGTARIAVDDILRVEAAADHVYFHTAERAYLYRITMTELERRLESSGLIRVHRSAFIRPERVRGTQRRGKVLEFLLDDGTQIAVGPSFRAAAMAMLHRSGADGAIGGRD